MKKTDNIVPPIQRMGFENNHLPNGKNGSFIHRSKTMEIIESQFKQKIAETNSRFRKTSLRMRLWLIKNICGAAGFSSNNSSIGLKIKKKAILYAANCSAAFSFCCTKKNNKVTPQNQREMAQVVPG